MCSLIKKSILIVFILFCFNLLAVDMGVKLSLLYDSNVYSLSQMENDDYTNHGKHDYIKAADDFIQRIGISLNEDYRINSIKISPFIKTSFSNFSMNNDKNSFNILMGINSRYEKLSLNASYGYYPDNYLRRYIDADGTGEREKYTYNRMMIRLTSSYNHSKLITPLLYYKHDIYHHNQYFTEYDATAHTIGVGWRFNTSLLNADIRYYYKDYNTKEENKNEKDASYKSSIYEVKLNSKRYYNTITDYRLYGSLNFENKYYQSVLPIMIDKYHTSREDKIVTFGVQADFYPEKNMIINIGFIYKLRDVSSDYDLAKKTKEYDKIQIGSSIEYKFPLF